MYLYSYAALTVYVISAVISGEGGWPVFSKHPLCLLDCGSESSEG